MLQETYVAAFTHLDQFEGRSSLATWLTRITVNKALARGRRMRRESPIEVGGENEKVLDADSDRRRRDDPQLAAHRGQLRALLAEVVDALPENLRTVFMLRGVEGRSVTEVAASLDLSEENVKQRVFRARGALRRKLEGLLRGRGDRAPVAPSCAAARSA